MDITIRRAEPSDAEALWKCFTSPRVVHSPLQLPYRSVESVRERLTKSEGGFFLLAAVVDGKVVGSISLHAATRPRIRHKGTLRKFAFRDGEFVDAYTMARVK